MIRVNGKVVNVEYFPDGTPRINLNLEELLSSRKILVKWNYESNDELMYLIMIKRHLDYLRDAEIYLLLPYVPNGRMDRVKQYKHEVFTLKYFCEIINSLNFKHVYTLDNHSDVSTALLNNCINHNPKKHIEYAISGIKCENLVLYFPDAGSAKRYADLFPELPYCYGEKKRDWKTGKILGLDIKTNEIDLENKSVFMVDDIIAYGGSLHYSCIELKKQQVNDIYAYATHTENSVLDQEKGTFIKDLESDTVKRLFTTNSLFCGNHEKITVMEAL